MEFTYRGLKAEYTRHTVTDTEVTQQIQRLQQQNKRITPVTDRPTQLGDEVVLDYAGFCDGVQFPGGTAENQTLVLGSGMFIPGFEEQLVDKVPGETVTVNVTFPEAYHSADLAGKAAEFRCTIHAIRISTPYELDDTFAKEVAGCETFAELEQKLKESMQAYADERGEMELQDRLLRAAADTLELEIAPEELEAELDEQMQTLSAQLAQQGLTMDMYCSFLNTTREALRSDAESAARASIRMRAAVEQIAQLEKLTATEQDIASALAVIARQNRMTVEQLKPHYDAEFEAAVIRSILTTKVMALIRENAIIEA